MTTYNLFVFRDLPKNYEIDNAFWGENKGILMDFDNPTVGTKIDIKGTKYNNYAPVDIRREFNPPMLIVEAKSI